MINYTEIPKFDFVKYSGVRLDINEQAEIRQAHS